MNSAPTSILLITPARNEAEHLPALLVSVTAQTLRPACWVITDDNSTDATAALATAAALSRPWLKVIRLEANGGRGFGAKAPRVSSGTRGCHRDR
jgi:glycosyltransferase involved in cell wall biosynthesis